MDTREIALERVPFLDVEEEDEKDLTSVSSPSLPWSFSKYPKFLHFLQNLRTTPHSRPQWSPETAQNFRIAMKNFASFFIPSFLRINTEQKELHETAYLDGLRGFACWCVFFSHYLTAYCNEVWHPYGEGGNHHFVQTYYIYQLPIIRLLFNGQAAVAIFFVLSGYVLSYNSLKLMHARDFEKLQSSLSSAIFRRWFRLFLPCVALWIVSVFLVQFGAYSWFTAYHAENPKMPPGMVEEYLEAGESFWGTVSNASSDFFEFARGTLFQWSNSGTLPKVDGHTWTLHVEFRCSCLLFLFLHGTSRMRPSLRLAFFIFSSAFALIYDEASIAAFLGGSAIADIDLRMRRRQQSNSQSTTPPSNESDMFLSLPSSRIPPRLRTLFRASKLYWSLSLFLTLMILSYPSVGADKVFFYRTLSYYHPSSAWDLFFYEALGALPLVYITARFSPLKRLLELPISQYMGKTSFALYLCHGTVIKTLGHFMVIKAWGVLGYKGWAYAGGILMPLVVVVPVLVVVTDWFWRGVDVRCVRFGKWVEGLVRDERS